MTPYYESGGITIYHGDCREIMPGLKADEVVTDPPYGMGADAFGDGGGGRLANNEHHYKDDYEGWKALIKIPLDQPEKLLSSSEITQYARKSLKITGMASKDGKIWFTAEDNGAGLIFFENEPK